MCYYINDDKYEEEFKDHRNNEYGIFCYADNAKYQGELIDSNKNVNEKYQADGIKYEGEFRDDKRNGEVIC